jgi:hypothetical protein
MGIHMAYGIKNVSFEAYLILPRESSLIPIHPVCSHQGFVNAQYRFVMNPEGDYTVHFADPDMYVRFLRVPGVTSYLPRLSFFQWHDVLQVIIPRSSALAAAAGGSNHVTEEGHTTCPICLATPTAPRMTKCGHVSSSPNVPYRARPTLRALMWHTSHPTVLCEIRAL